MKKLTDSLFRYQQREVISWQQSGRFNSYIIKIIYQHFKFKKSSLSTCQSTDPQIFQPPYFQFRQFIQQRSMFPLEPESRIKSSTSPNPKHIPSHLPFRSPQKSILSSDFYRVPKINLNNIICQVKSPHWNFPNFGQNCNSRSQLLNLGIWSPSGKRQTATQLSHNGVKSREQRNCILKSGRKLRIVMSWPFLIKVSGGRCRGASTARKSWLCRVAVVSRVCPAHQLRAVKQHSIYKFKLTTNPYNYYLYIQSMSRKQTQSRRQQQDSVERRPLYDIDAHKQRVTQTNMVYLIGLPHQLADEHLLGQEQYCGQYGNIIKLLVKENHFNEFRSYCAYVTYEREDSAAVAVLALNNFVFQGSRIYASYGTNKYCSAFVRFGKCKKPDCPFLHNIDRQKEIRQEDNRKLFQEQQQLARRFIIANERTIDFTKPDGVVFPTMAEIRRRLVEDGSIKPRDSKIRPDPICSRPSSPENIKTFRSQASTQCSPAKDSREMSSEVDIIESPSIMNLIIRKVAQSKKSLFSFAGQINAGELDQATKQLRTYFLQCQQKC